jgi:hypothetical protein
MQGSEFVEYLKNFANILPFYKGVYSINTLPQTLKIHNFVFCNTATSNSKGEHWFCVVKTKKNELELFDSLGVNENKEDFYLTNLKFKEKHLTFNQTQFQENSSETCGLFCLYFIVHYLYNYELSFDDLLEAIFVTDCSKNESLVKQFFDES